MRKLGGVVFSILLVSSMVTPVTAFSQEENLGTAEGMDILQKTEELSADQQHALAASLLESYTGSESDAWSQPKSTTGGKQWASEREQIEELRSDSAERREKAPSRDLLSEDTVERIEERAESGTADRAMFRSHARATSDLAGHVDRRRDLNVRIDAATSMLVRADRERARQSIDSARQTFQLHRSDLSPEQRREIRTELRAATEHYHAASTRVETRRGSLERTTRARAESIRQYGTAHSIAESASASVAQSAPVEVEITSRGDLRANVSEPYERTIAGEITGAQSENIDSVIVEVDGNQTFDADVSKQDVGATFESEVTVEKRITSINVTVNTSPIEEASPDEEARSSGSQGTSDTGMVDRSLTRLLPENATTAGSGDADFDIDTSSATTVLDPSTRTVTRSVTLESEAPASTTTQRVRILESRTATNAYPEPPGTTVTVLDVLAREGTPADDRQSAVVYNTTRSDIRSVYGELPENLDQSVRFYRFNDTANEWEPVPAVVSERNDGTVTVRTLITTDVTTSLLGLSVAEDGDSVPTPTTTPTPTVAGETEPTKTPDSAGGAPETDEDGGVIDSIVSIIRDIIDGILDLFSTDTGTSTSRTAGIQARTPADTESGVEPSIQSQEMATDQLRLDGDGLTDEFETETLGTDPLDPDSDTPQTADNEADDGIIDGFHDPDNDTLINAGEAANGLNPLDNDTDDDGLSDGDEAQFPELDGTRADSSGNGVSDGAADPDADGLDTTAEFERDTTPFNPDSDADGLNDGREGNLSTDPLGADSDDDGLSDSDELELPTEPTDPDTDGDGVLDGDETFTTTATNESLNASVDITGEGNVAAGVTIENGTDVRIANTGTVQNASVSPVVDFQSEAEFDSATVSLGYDSEQVTDPQNLAVYRRNETTGEYEPLDSTVDADSNTVSAKTSHFSRFVVFRVPNWASNFDAIEPPNIEDEAGLIPVDAAFVLDSSGSMGRNDPDDLRLDASKRFVAGLIEGEDRAAVVDFDSNARTLQSLTTDFRSVNRSIDQVDSAGGTNIADGIDESVSEYQQNSNDSRAKIAVLLTDGIDSSNKQAAAQRAADENITIYTVGFGSARESDLKTIADTTGGNFTLVNSPEELPNVFERIAEETGPQDSDGDGIDDGQELGGFKNTAGQTIRTDPFDTDTDGDGISDGREVGEVVEVERTVNITTADSTGDPEQVEYNETRRKLTSNPTDIDTDSDGLPDRQEYGTFDIKYTNDPDSTTDLLSTRDSLADEATSFDIDAFTETSTMSPDPNSRDTDGDGIPDGREITIGTDPTDDDTDGDGIPDKRERELSEEDPTLFDNSRPEIDIQYLDTDPVKIDRGSTSIPAIDRKYTVRYKVTDPSGLDTSALKRGELGDRSIEVTEHGGSGETVAVVTAEVLANRLALSSVADIALGQRVKLKADDVHGNSVQGSEFVTKGGPNLYTYAVKAIGDNIPDFPLAKTPLVLIGALEGLAEAIVADLKSLLTLILIILPVQVERVIGTVVNVAPGVNLQPETIGDALRTAADTAQTMLREGALGTIEAVAIGIQSDQQDSNPFETPDFIADGGPADDLLDLNLRGGVFSSNSYVSFAGGWYNGYILSFVVTGLLTAGAAVAAKIPGILGRASKLLLNNLAKLDDALGKLGKSVFTVGNAIPIGSALVSGTDTLDEDATPGIVTGLAELTFVQNVRVREQYLAISATLPQAVFDRVQQIHPNIDQAEARTLTRYLARTGDDAPTTLDSAALGLDTSRLLAPGSISRTTNARIQRIIVEGQASGELTEQDVQRSLDKLENGPNDRADRRALINMVSTTGTEGVVFLSETSRADTADVAETLVDQRTARGGSGGNPDDPSRGSDSGVGLDGEFRQMVRQAGGENASVAVDKLSTDQLVKLLKLKDGSAPVARANIVNALADGELTASEVESFVDEVNAASLSDRQQRVNNVAYSANTTEAADAVTAG